MKCILFKYLAIVSLICTYTGVLFSQQSIPAFPTAAGFGRDTQGARGGTDPTVYVVDSLEDDGTKLGTLRHAVETVPFDSEGKSKGRFIVFSVGGVIMLEEGEPLEINIPNVTIAGQTAPNGGICVMGEGVFVNASEVIIRGLRVRPSDYHYLQSGPTSGRDSMKVGKSKYKAPDLINVIIDHCSFSWSVDEIASAYRSCRNVTYQYSIFAEALYDSIHQDDGDSAFDNGPHSMGPAFGPWAENISFYRNLVAHTAQRNPMLKETENVEIVNNVFYDFGSQALRCSDDTEEESGTDKEEQDLKANIIGNMWLGGPSIESEFTNNQARLFRISIGDSDVGTELYFANNVAHFNGFHLEHNEDPFDINDPFYHVRGSGSQVFGNTLKSSPVFSGVSLGEIAVLSSAETELDFLLDTAGARWPMRDAIDARIVNNIETGGGHIVDAVFLATNTTPPNWDNPVGSYSPPDVDSDSWPKVPDYANLGSSIIDCDNDGIPDVYEPYYGSFNLGDDDNDGYYNIEDYFNAIIDGTLPDVSTELVSLNPVHDTFVHKGMPAENYDEGKLFVKNTDPSNAYYRVSYLRFDASSLQEEAVSGCLTLTVGQVGNPNAENNNENVGEDVDHSLRLVSSNTWDESTLDFNTVDSDSLLDLGTVIDTQTINATVGQKIMFTLNQAALNQINNSGYLSVAIEADGDDTTLLYEDNEAAANQPVLNLVLEQPTVELNPVHDAFVRKGLPAENYDEEKLYVKNTDPTDTYYRVSYLRFDASSLQDEVASGSLTLTVGEVGNPNAENNNENVGENVDHSLRLVSSNTWDESTLDFNTVDSDSSLDLGTVIDTQTINATVGHTITFTLNQAALNQINNSGYLSVAIEADGDDTTLLYEDSEAAANPPVLSLTYGEGSPVGDTEAPVVSIDNPAAQSTVSDTIVVTASASDNVGVAGVQFKLNGNNLGSEDTTAPYSVAWDTALEYTGTYSLTAVARDAANNTTTSSGVSVTVDDPSPALNSTFDAGGASSWTPASSVGTWGVYTSGESGETDVYRQSDNTTGASQTVLSNLDWTDQVIEADVYVNSFAEGDKFVGVIGRFVDEYNYYYLILRSSDKIQLKKLVGNMASTLLEVGNFDVIEKEWYTLRLEIVGSTLKGYVNGSLVAQASDSTFSQGDPGLLTFRADASFDDVIATPDVSGLYPFADDFEDNNSNGWTGVSGSWSVATDGSKVYSQSSTSVAGIATIDASNWSDQIMEADLKAPGFSSNGWIGLLGRYHDVNNYYYVALDKDNNELSINKMVDGSATSLALTSFTISSGTWYDVRFKMLDTTLKVYVDGELKLAATDSDINDGTAGVVSSEASVSADDVIITAP